MPDMPQIEGSTIAVIGGAGFIGSHIVDQLLDEPVERVIVVDNFVAEHGGISSVPSRTLGSRSASGRSSICRSWNG